MKSAQYPFRRTACSLLALLLLCCCVPSRAQAPAPEGGSGPPPGAMGPNIRGTVTALAGNQATLKTESGEAWQVKLGPNARILARDPNNREAGPQTKTVSDIHPGDALIVFGDIDTNAKTANAALAMLIDAATVKKAMADWGITYVSGKVTAIDETKITVERQDGKKAVAQADENTSFRKGHDSITLADVQVGDMVMARGALKNGVFVPQQFAVRDPEARPGIGGHLPPGIRRPSDPTPPQ